MTRIKRAITVFLKNEEEESFKAEFPESTLTIEFAERVVNITYTEYEEGVEISASQTIFPLEQVLKIEVDSVVI